MFGILRLFLSLLVVASHVDLPHQLDLGAVAVTVFFLLSGFVMTAKVERDYSEKGRYWSFIADRVLRIYPQFLFWTALAVVWYTWFEPNVRRVSGQALLENTVLFPLMYHALESLPWLSGVRYVSQAWSLSLEWHFYMLLPFLVWYPFLRIGLLGLSLTVFASATFHWIDPSIFAYRTIPGVLFIFLIGGMLFYRAEINHAKEGRALTATLIVVLLIAIVGNCFNSLHYHWTAEVLVGLMIGLPLLTWLGKNKPNAIDRLCGNLSYGVFLNHYLVLSIFYKYECNSSNRWVFFLQVAGASTVLSGLSLVFIEQPFTRRRRRIDITKSSQVAQLN